MPAGVISTETDHQIRRRATVVELERHDAVRRRVVRVGNLIIGEARPVVIAGPCSVEPGYVDQAVDIAETGVDALRAGGFQPRAHPDSFQGMGLGALALPAGARDRTRLPPIPEVLAEAGAAAV